MMADFDDYMRVCEAAVRAGGQVVQDWAGRFDVRKKGPADLVTQADFASQEVVRKMVLTAFPDHSLLGEEAGDCPDFRGRGEAVVNENGTVPLRPHLFEQPGRLRREANTAGSSIRWTGRRTTSTACRIIVFRWRWSATAACWSARCTIRFSTSVSRPSRAAAPG